MMQGHKLTGLTAKLLRTAVPFFKAVGKVETPTALTDALRAEHTAEGQVRQSHSAPEAYFG